MTVIALMPVAAAISEAPATGITGRAAADEQGDRLRDHPGAPDGSVDAIGGRITTLVLS